MEEQRTERWGQEDRILGLKEVWYRPCSIYRDDGRQVFGERVNPEVGCRTNAMNLRLFTRDAARAGMVHTFPNGFVIRSSRDPNDGIGRAQANHTESISPTAVRP